MDYSTLEGRLGISKPTLAYDYKGKTVTVELVKTTGYEITRGADMYSDPSAYNYSK